MKRTLLSFTFLLLALVGKAQISIVSSDLPSNGVIAVRSSSLPFTGMSVTATGANYTWDFSQLSPTGQQIDTFFSESAGNPLLSIYFSNTIINPNRSNHSSPGTDFSLGTTIALTNVYNYYYNSSSAYSQTGIGAEVNGVPLPITYSPHDRIYKLPMTFGQQDSVTYSYGIDLTSTLGLYYNVRKKRVNSVDGWGTIITPFQSYSCLRVKTQIIETDSIYLDTLGGIGFTTPPITTYEYKWLATGQKIPVLQINTSGGGSVTSILYKDSPVSVPVVSNKKTELSIFPNPCTDHLTVQSAHLRAVQLLVQLFDLNGRLVMEMNKNTGAGESVETIETSTLPSGTYLVKVMDGSTLMGIESLVKN